MTDIAAPTRSAAYGQRLRKRYAAERRFRMAGAAAILFSVAVLVFLLVSMTLNGVGGFQRTTFEVPIDLSATRFYLPTGEPEPATVIGALESQGLPQIVKASAEKAVGIDGARELSPDAWRSVADLIVRLIRSPRLHLRGNIGVNKPGSEADKPYFM